MATLTKAQVRRVIEFADAALAHPEEYRAMRAVIQAVDSLTTDQMIDKLEMRWGTSELRFGASDAEIADELRRQILRDYGFEVLS